MAETLPPIVAVLEANYSKFAAAMGEVKAETAATTSSAGSAFHGMAGIGKTALLGLGAVAIGVGAVALKMGGDFQQSMTALVTGAGESQSNLAMVSKGILDMAGQVGVSAQDLASGMYMVESAGYHGAAGLTVLKTAAMGAKVGNADMATVADALTSALNAYHLPASQATAVTNDLIATVASGKMHMQDLTGSLGAVLPAASAAGVSLAQVTGAIATMTMQGTPAADAATYLRQTILMLENPSAKAQKAMQDVGLTAGQVSAALREKGLSGALELATDAISKKFTPGSQEYISHLAEMVGGTKSMQAALELTGPNMATFKANIGAINEQVSKGGDTVQGWTKVQEDFNFKTEAAKDKLGALAITLGEELIPYVEKAMDATAQLAGWLDKHRQVASAVAAAIGGVLVVAVAAYTVAMVQAAIATLVMAAPWLLLIAAVALLSVGIYELITHWGQVTKFIQTEWHKAVTFVVSLFDSLWSKVVSFGTNFLKQAEQVWGEFSKKPGYYVGYAIGEAIGHLVRFGNDFHTWSGQFLMAVIEWGANLGIQAYYAWLNFTAKAEQVLWSFITGELPNLLVQIPGAVRAFEGQMIDAGYNLLLGIGQGISNAQWWVVQQAIGAAQGILNGVKSALGISSPSALFAKEVGAPIMQGVAIGAKAQTPLVAGAVGSAVASTATSSSFGVTRASGASTGRMEELLEQLVELLSGTASNHFTVQIGNESIQAMASRQAGPRLASAVGG